MRKELRFVSNALVYVVDGEKNEKQASLLDLSKNGLSIKSDSYIDIEPNSSYVIAIIPEQETNVEKFKLEIESRWIKLKKSKMESGFSIIVPFDQNEFKDYLDFLAKKNKQDKSPANGKTHTRTKKT